MAPRRARKGFNASECISEFMNQCTILEEEQRGFMIYEGPPLIPGQPILVPMKRYFQLGDADSVEAKEHREQLKMKIVTL